MFPTLDWNKRVDAAFLDCVRLLVVVAFPIRSGAQITGRCGKPVSMREQVIVPSWTLGHMGELFALIVLDLDSPNSYF